MLSSCAHDQTEHIARNLDPSKLYPIFSTNIIDFKPQSKCPAPTSVKLVNAVTRNENIIIIKTSGHTHYIKPTELTNNIMDYMNDAFGKCQVKVDGSSTKIIEVSIDKLEAIGRVFGALGASIQMTISIPEKQYTKTYSAEDWTGLTNEWNVYAYAIHRVTWKIIEDPVVQNYILCK